MGADGRSVPARFVVEGCNPAKVIAKKEIPNDVNMRAMLAS